MHCIALKGFIGLQFILLFHRSLHPLSLVFWHSLVRRMASILLPVGGHTHIGPLVFDEIGHLHDGVI